jgi:hypothetical protein
MAELSQKVVPYEFNYLCDVCGSGMLQATGAKKGDEFFHVCMICSAEALLAKSYPHVEYFAVGQEPDNGA